MAEEQNSPNMQDDPQATQHIEPAEPTHDDVSAARTEPIAPVRESEGDIAQTKTFESTAEPATEIAAESAAPGTAPAQGTTEQPATPAYGQYRPAPEYGAYGPVPTQPAQPNQSQNAPTQPIQQGQPMQQNPNNGNPFGMPNPFAARSSQQQGNQGQPNHQMPNGQPTQRFGIFGGGVPPIPPQNGQNQNGQPNMPDQPGQQPNGKKNNSTTTTVLTAVIAAALSAALCLGLGYAAITSGAVKVPTTSSMANINSSESGSGSATAKTGEAPDWQAVAKEVSGSVVAIQATLSNGVAKGSGAILDTAGNIVTNNHVISGAQKILVTLSNGQMYSANVVGTDTTTDLAVIKLENPPSDLKAVKFANSDKLAVGENVMAVGNPLGYDDTATTGIVSALNRPVTVMDDDNNNIVTNAVQIDAAVNPGNSGGPTFNAAGEVIGINSSIATAGSSDSSGSGSIGIGFAIPSNLVKRVADEIVKDGSVKHVALGVTVKTDTVEADGVTRAGARITSSATGNAVVKGGPADKAGLKSGDTIVAFDGHAVNSTASLLGFVRATALGDKATLTIVRDGKTMDVDVTLDQQEDKVNGSNRTESNSQRNQSQNNQDDQNQYQNGDGSDGSDGSNGSNGFPFNLW